MRIHRLRLRGIGPFRDEQSVDFDLVGRSRLFLLDGATGVGKSTVIDAIVYALYGQPAGDGARDQLVSDFLTDIRVQDRPFVELVFSTGAGTYRIVRQPKHEHQGRSGAPTTRPATVRLERLATEEHAEGDVLSTRAGEVDSEVRRAVGLNREQFLSTIVLAQGAFARFLRADSEQRRQILESVFATGAYTDMQRYLAELQRQAVAERRGVEQEIARTVAEFCESADVPVEERGAWQELAADDPDALVQRSRALLAHHGEQVRRAEAGHAAAGGEVERCRSELESAVAQEHAWLRRVGLLRRRGELEANRPAIDRIRAQVHRHAQSAAAVRALEDLERARQAADQAEQSWLAAATALPLDLRGSGADELAGAESRAAEELIRLEPVRQAESQADAKRGLLASRRVELTRCRERLADVGERRSSAQLRASAQAARIADLEPVAALLGVREQDHAHAERLFQVARQRDAVRSRVGELAGAVQDATTHARKLAGQHQAMRAAHYAGIAGELAADLAPDAPCPVCGSVDHPDLAQPTPNHATREQVEAAEGDWRMADRDLHEREIEHQAARTRLQELERELDGRTTAQLATLLADTADLVTQAKDAAEHVGAGRTESAAISAELAQVDAAIGSAEAERVHLEADLLRLEEEVAQVDREITAARGDAGSVHARCAAVQELQRVCAAAAAAVRLWEDQRRACALRQEHFDQTLARLGLPDEQAVRGSDLGAERAEALAAQVTAFDEEWAATRAQLAEPELSRLAETQPIELAPLRARLTQAQDRVEAALSAAVGARSRFQAGDAAWHRVETALQGARDVLERTAPILRLANLATAGDRNLLRVTLASYVVMRRFREVVDAANVRLTEMSDGLYRLQVAPEQAEGRERKVGLGLEIVDNRTDRPRSTASLSGGETFYTSLALALGLADIVQSEAGGVRLDTLFVDEGFGSLDSETLDTVMNVLARLRAADRTVGLISHVEEMKTRIGDRIHVHRPRPDGPAEIVVAT